MVSVLIVTVWCEINPVLQFVPDGLHSVAERTTGKSTALQGTSESACECGTVESTEPTTDFVGISQCLGFVICPEIMILSDSANRIAIDTMAA